MQQGAQKIIVINGRQKRYWGSLVKEMADLDEPNEFFDLISYPEKVENIADKQGITIKGTDQEVLKL